MNDRGRIDWNLIPTLDALLTERNVSRAARRLGVTQPAMSNALARLRRHFGDELLVRHGNTYALTPTAERLAALARQAVSSSLSLVSSGAEFEPAESVQEFTIAASDYVQATVMPFVLRELHRRAPSVTVAVVAPFVEPFRTPKDIIASTDGWLAPQEMLPGESHSGALDDRWVCVVTESHPTVGDELSMDDVRELAWVAPTIRGKPLGLYMQSLMARGVEPIVEVSTEGFTAVPFLVAGTDRIGLMQHSLATRLAGAAGVRILECPWPAQPLRLTFWWDSRWESDAAHSWLRGAVSDALEVARGSH
jgi:DNA-binding transcriptional LysR family regulator